MVASDLSTKALSELLEQHPYRRFPVVDDGRLTGIASRAEITAAMKEHRQLNLEEAVTCRPDQSIRKSQAQLIQSATGTLVITDDSESKLLGIMTLHDLVRAQLAVAERESGSG